MTKQQPRVPSPFDLPVEDRYHGPPPLAEGQSVFSHNPADRLFRLLDAAERMEEAPPIPMSFGIGRLDELVPTIHGGRFVVVMGRPSMGKTTLLRQLAAIECRAISHRAATAGVDESEWGEYVMYVSMEEGVNDVTLAVQRAGFTMTDVVLGRRGSGDLRAQFAPTVRTNLFVMSDDVRPIWKGKLEDGSFSAPAIWEEIIAIREKTNRTPTAIFIDYLQEMGWGRGGAVSRTDEVRANAEACRSMAKRLGVPVILASQARREVDESWKRGYHPIPEIGDSEWSAKAEQAGDVVLSVTMPYRWPEAYLDKIERVFVPAKSFPDRAYAITPDLMIVQVLKQRGLDGRGRVVLSQNFSDGSLSQANPLPTFGR